MCHTIYQFGILNVDDDTKCNCSFPKGSDLIKHLRELHMLHFANPEELVFSNMSGECAMKLCSMVS